jgi:aspartate aminotransferase-like enzyme
VATLGTALQTGKFRSALQRCLGHPYDSLQTYGAKVDQLKAAIGATVSQSEIETALKSKKYKILTFTHVDTSTGMCLLIPIITFN